MDSNRKAAIAIAVFVAAVMICVGFGFVSYTYGYRVAHETIYGQRQDQGKSADLQPGYSSDIEVSDRPSAGAGT